MISRRQLCSCAALFVGCSHGHDPNRVRVAIGNPTSLDYLPLILAHQLGYFREVGLQVELQETAGASRAAQALLSGNADLVASMFEQVLQATSEKQRLRAFYILTESPGIALMSSPAPGKQIRQIEDLKGKTIAVSTPGSPTHLLLNAVLRRHGIEAGAFSVVGSANTSARVMALESGKVDAAILPEPGITVLRDRHPEALMLADLFSEEGRAKYLGHREYPGLAVFTTERWLAGNKELARRFAQQLVRAASWARSHTASEVAGRMPAQWRLQDLGLYAKGIANVLPTLSTDGRLSEDAARAVQDVMRPSRPIQDYYTNEFLQ